jgi:predicted protein tyrosine phosphatase
MIETAEHWLFVCSANYIRSPTAEYVARRQGLLADSCGTHLGRLHSFVVQPLSADLVRWAHVIVCMEQHHEDVLRRRHPRLVRNRRVLCWNVPDNWGKVYHPELVSIIEHKLEETLCAKRAGHHQD